MVRPALTAAAPVAALVAFPSNASAHLVTTGLGPFYDGMSHLLLTPQDLLPLLAVALFAGLSGREAARGVLFGVPAAWFVGGLIGLGRAEELTLPLVTVGSVLLLGGLLAADRDVPGRLVVGLGITVGFVHGFLNGTAMSAAGLGAVGLLGIASAGFVLVALAGALAVRLHEGWTRVAVRVAGSWIVATGLFMLGWTLR